MLGATNKALDKWCHPGQRIQRATLPTLHLPLRRAPAGTGAQKRPRYGLASSAVIIRQNPTFKGCNQLVVQAYPSTSNLRPEASYHYIIEQTLHDRDLER